MQSLLIIAHGSRSAEANEEIRLLTQSIRKDPENNFDQIAHAFLEIAKPAVAVAIATLAESGAAKISVFPYFLAGGIHVANDVPRLIKEAQEKHAHVDFEILPYLGAIDGLSTLILRQINGSDL
jgi:sirohydrochlorin ferrochelatase